MKPELSVTQTIGEKPVYRIEDLLRVTGSRATAYRALGELRQVGFAEQAKEGFFTIRSSIFQPFYLWPHLVPSLDALKQARYFGLSYNENDVKLARRVLEGMVTLDYRAYELTGLQVPHMFFMYSWDVDQAASTLRKRGFWEGKRGRVAILPRIGSFQNELHRVYLDCIAYGGRSVLDAIAIQLVRGAELDLKIRGLFRAEDVLKVRDELSSREPRARSG